VAALGVQAEQGSGLPRGAVAELEAAATDPDPRIRTAAVAALVRAAGTRRATGAWRRACADPAPEVRRRAAELTPKLSPRPNARPLVDLLDDPEVTVVEASAWALGELGESAAVPRLVTLATKHDDPLAREAAVAALGAIGDRAGLAAILAACKDKPAVRRRAVLALAPFDGPEVDAALENALKDRDWQTRQAAEDLRG